MWQFKAGAGFQGARRTSGGLIFAADLGGTLHALDASTGPRVGASAAQPVARADRGGRCPLCRVVGRSRLRSRSGDRGEPVGVGRAARHPVDRNAVTEGVAYIGGGGRLFAIRLVDKAGGVAPVQTTSTEQSTAVLVRRHDLHLRNYPTAATPEQRDAGDRSCNGQGPLALPSPSGQQVNPGPVRDGIVYVNTAGDGVYALRDRGGSGLRHRLAQPRRRRASLPAGRARGRHAVRGR